MCKSFSLPSVFRQYTCRYVSKMRNNIKEITENKVSRVLLTPAITRQLICRRWWQLRCERWRAQNWVKAMLTHRSMSGRHQRTWLYRAKYSSDLSRGLSYRDADAASVVCSVNIFAVGECWRISLMGSVLLNTARVTRQIQVLPSKIWYTLTLFLGALKLLSLIRHYQ